MATKEVKEAKAEVQMAQVSLADKSIHRLAPAVRTNNTLIFHIGNGGGTGGVLAMNILKFMAFDKDITTTYIGADGDEFEAKNLGRQLCIPADMGKNKSEVIVKRYARAFGLSPERAMWMDRFITTSEEILDVCKDYKNIIIIDTVDKNKPRLDIMNAINILLQDTNKTVASISCGNGEWNGQTVFGYKFRGAKDPRKHKSTIFSDPYTFNAPTAMEIFKEMVDLELDKQEEALSCADRAVANAQSLIANNTAATIALNFLTQYLKASYHENFDKAGKPTVTIDTSYVRFNALTNSYVPQIFDDNLFSSIEWKGGRS